MGRKKVVKHFGAVTLDQEFASQVWLALFNGDQELCEQMAIKMYIQDCGLSDELEELGFLAEWSKPIVEHIHALQSDPENIFPFPPQ